MFSRMLGAEDRRDLLLRALVAVTCAVVSTYLFTELLAAHALARYWEPWLREYGRLGSDGPMLFVALLPGLVTGIVIALLFRRQPVRVAAAAALLVLGWSAFAALSADDSIVSEFLLWILVLGVGLLFGAALVGRFRNARAIAAN